MKTNTRDRSGATQTYERSFQDYLAIIVRGKWVILGVFLGVLALTFLVTKLMDPVYKASCQILLSTRDPGSTLFKDAAWTDRRETITQNELAILNSRTLADSVAMRLLTQRYLDKNHSVLIPIIRPEQGTNDSLAPMEVVSGRLTELIDFDPVRESDVITIAAKSQNALETALIANTFAEAYRDRNIYLSRAKSRAFREFLERQMDDKRESLRTTEEALQAYMERQGIASLDDEAKKVIDQLAELEANRDATNIQLRQLENTLQSYQEQLPQQETNVARMMGEASDPYIRLLQDQIARLEVQRDMAVAQNPSLVGRENVDARVREIDAQIASLRDNLQQRTDDFLRSLTPAESGKSGDATGYLKSVKQKIIETGIEVQALQAKKSALEDVVRQYEGQLDRLPAKSVELARLQRARVSTERIYLMVEEKYNEANITEKSNIGYVEIIERAAVPFAPASPKPLINLAIGVLLGLGLGLGIVFMREGMDVRIHSPEDVKRRNLVPLGTVIAMDGEILRLAGRKAGGNGARKVDSHLVTLTYPFSSVAESYRQLRTNLQFSRSGQVPRALLLTSSIPGEGKSTTVSNLAVAFAQAGKTVLLVDADLRMPNLSTDFRVKKEPGLAEYVSGKASLETVVQRTQVDKLFLVACGQLPPNPAELLGAEKMREFAAAVREEFDVVLYDSPPLLAATDPSVISTLVDGTVVVVSAGRTRVEELEQGIEHLERVGANIVGVLVNNFDPHRAYGITYRRVRHRYYSYGSYQRQRPTPPPSVSKKA
jgi:capsular exopolysaccharide synthesis family protein